MHHPKTTPMGALISLIWLALVTTGCPGPEASTPRAWSVQQEHLPGDVLSIWGSSERDLFAVGGPLSADGGAAMVLHGDGSTWSSQDAPGTTLWWVFGFAADDVWAVGERGVIVHYDGASWSLVEEPTHDYTLWGVWGAAPDDLWTVGGVAAGGAPSVIRHYDGVSFSDVSGVGQMGELLFKVWGSAADDMWVVGTGGAILHWDGAAFTRVDSGVTGRLLTVRGRAADDVYAVGGLASPLLLHFDGTSWRELPLDTFSGLMGVWTGPGQGVAVSGARGALFTDDGRGFVGPVGEGPTELDLHVVWGDGTGRLYAGGGDLLSSGAPEGILLSSEAPPSP